MKKVVYYLIIIFCFNLTNAQFNFQRNWATYFGDERFIFTDSAIDSYGNLYIIGTLNGTDLTNIPAFTNSNSYHQNYNGGLTDGFLIKFNTAGTLVWGTFIGGENEDKIMALDIDKDNNIYIIGDTNSLTNIATIGSFQQNYAGNIDLFISKFNENGNIVWSTYYGGTETDYNPSNLTDFNSFPKRTHISLDGNGSFYIASGTNSSLLSTTGVFQENRGTSNYLISKFSENGNRIWTTYFGVNTYINHLKANANAVYVTGLTLDCPPNNTYNTYYGTINGFKQFPSNCRDIFLNKFNTSTGQREWGTYYGGSAGEILSTNSIFLKNNKIYLSGGSSNYINQEISTVNSYQAQCNGYSNFIAQFNENGTRNWGTYNGNLQVNQATLAPSSVSVDNSSNYYNYGATALIDISTSDGYKVNPSNEYSFDAFICKFDENNNKLWGTYYGGIGNETNIRFHSYDNDTKFYIVGITTSVNDITTPNSYQPNKSLFDTSTSIESVFNIFIAHFEPAPLSNSTFNENSFSIYPNPNNGNFTISLKENATQEVNMILYDVLGKEIQHQKLNNSETIIKTNSLSKGVYFAKIFSEKVSITKKIVIE